MRKIIMNSAASDNPKTLISYNPFAHNKLFNEIEGKQKIGGGKSKLFERHVSDFCLWFKSSIQLEIRYRH